MNDIDARVFDASGLIEPKDGMSRRCIAAAGLCVLLWGCGATDQPGKLADAVGKRDAATVRSLLAAGANPNEVDKASIIKGWTPLMAAARVGSADIVEALLKAGANVNAATDYGATALDVAIGNHGSSSAVAGLIIAAGGKGKDSHKQDPTSEAPTTAASESQETGSAAGTFSVGLAGGLTVGADIPTIVKKPFTCTPVAPLKKGDPLAPTYGGDSIYSLDTWKFTLDIGSVEIPILGMIKSSKGAFQLMFPAILKPSIDMNPGAMLQLDGYQIEVAKAAKAGESIPVIVFVGAGIMSIRPADGPKVIQDQRPWFVAYEDRSNSVAGRASMLEMWRAVLLYAVNL